MAVMNPVTVAETAGKIVEAVAPKLLESGVEDAGSKISEIAADIWKPGSSVLKAEKLVEPEETLLIPPSGDLQLAGSKPWGDRAANEARLSIPTAPI